MKLLLLLLIQSPFLTCFYLYHEPLWIILNQVVISIFLVLMDNAITVNLQNIHSLNINFEELLKGITKIASKKEINLDEKFYEK